MKKSCLFCAEGNDRDQLFVTPTLGTGPAIQSYALPVQDKNLMNEFTTTDLRALEDQYHKLCCTR